MQARHRRRRHARERLLRTAVVGKGHAHLDGLAEIRLREGVGRPGGSRNRGVPGPVVRDPLPSEGGIGQPVLVLDRVGRGLERLPDPGRSGDGGPAGRRHVDVRVVHQLPHPHPVDVGVIRERPGVRVAVPPARAGREDEVLVALRDARPPIGMDQAVVGIEAVLLIVPVYGEDVKAAVVQGKRAPARVPEVPVPVDSDVVVVRDEWGLHDVDLGAVGAAWSHTALRTSVQPECSMDAVGGRCDLDPRLEVSVRLVEPAL